MKNLFLNSLLVALLVCPGLACEPLDLIPDGTDYLEADNAKTAAAAIRKKIGKPFNVAEVFMNIDEFTVQAQDPDNQKNVNEYKYDGGVVNGPNPAKYDYQRMKLEEIVFPFDEINFAAVPEIARKAVEKAGIEGGKVSLMVFQRGLLITSIGPGFWDEASWHIGIKGTRETAWAKTDPKGNLLGINLSQSSQAKGYQMITVKELQKTQNYLQNALEADAPIEEILIYDKSLNCHVTNLQDPITRYKYQFSIEGFRKSRFTDTPMDISLREKFSLSDIKLPDAVAFVGKAKKRVNLPGATLVRISIRREKSILGGKDSRITWVVSFEKGVNYGVVFYDNEGNELLFVKNGKTVSGKK